MTFEKRTAKATQTNTIMSTPNSNHPYIDLEQLIQDLTSQLVPQKGHDKPHCDFDDSELYDGKARTQFVQGLLFKPGELAPSLVTVGNDLLPLQRLIGGTITVLPEVGIEGALIVANDEAILLSMPPSRYVEAMGIIVFGGFLVLGGGVNFCSLNESQIEAAVRAFALPVTLDQIQTALRLETEGLDYMESESLIDRELNDALGE